MAENYESECRAVPEVTSYSRRSSRNVENSRNREVYFAPSCTIEDCENLQSPDDILDDIEDYDDIEDEPEVEWPLCTKDLRAASACGRPSTSRGPCPRPDVIASLTPKTDVDAVRNVIEQVANEEITTAAEFIFSLTPYVADRGAVFRDILERELSFFRDIVDDTVDRRIQDEADVMMNTQNDIKNKFRSLTDAMTQRITGIRQRLYEISPTFDWARDGRDRGKISKLIVKPLSRDLRKEKKTTDKSNVIDKLTHQVFMRGQWLKKELTRLQEENDNLVCFLEKFRTLADERKEQESHVPKMLSKERKQLERELNELRQTYRRNLEIINALYIEHQRCIMPEEDTSFVDC